VDETQATHRVAADADASALTQTILRSLMHGFVSQRAGAADDADAAGFVDVAWHDADLALARGDDAGAVRPDQHAARVLAAQGRLDLDHIVHRDALGDADDDLDAGVSRFEDRVGRERRRYIDHGGVGAGLGNGVVYG